MVSGAPPMDMAPLPLGMATAVLAALAVGAVVAAAEWRHARRVRRAARLAFVPVGRPAAWVHAVPGLRVAATSAAAWGFLFLAAYDPVAVDPSPSVAASRHLLILLDVSPSMQVKDAGPEVEKQSRAAWAGRVVQGVLDRLDMASTRITILAFYTDALPIVADTFDKEVVRNALDGLPMHVAFEPGPTNLQKGLVEAAEIARPWARDSATLLLVSDGDAQQATPPRMPGSIADVIVVGVGDPARSTVVGGHSSRQDSMSLKQIAARLGGTYHEGNRRHLPSALLERLTMVAPRISDRLSWRDAALVAAAAGSAVLALAGPALMLWGRRGVSAGGSESRQGSTKGRERAWRGRPAPAGQIAAMKERS